MTSSELSTILQPSSMTSSLKIIYNSSPKAVVSESSPIKKRRVNGFCSIDYRHRRGSRSGDLALLRVLSAPSSPLAPSSNSSGKCRPLLTSLKSKHHNEQRIFILPRPLSPVKDSRAYSPLKSLELKKEHLNSHKQPRISDDTLATPRQAHISKQNMKSNKTESSNPQKALSSTVLENAEALAKSTAVHYKQFIPIREIDDVTAFFNIEAPRNLPEAGTESSQLAQAPAPRASLKERIEALPSGESLLLVYPTRRGAETFVDEMLMPVLEPLLRRTVNLHRLPAEAAKSIHQESRRSFKNMFEYDELKEIVNDVVRSANKVDKKCSFSIKFQESTVVQVSAAAWKNAWTDQEREFIKESIDEGLKLRGGGANVNYSGIEHPIAGIRVAEELLNSFKKHKVEEWEKVKEQDKIEVGVFVIARR